MNQSLINYTLHLADDSLILGQRNAEWCGQGPVLEQDIAITNISLDLIGQARHFYQFAAELLNHNKTGSDKKETEDTLAYLRTEREFRNCLMVELPRGDWAFTILRQFFFSQHRHLLFQQLKHVTVHTLAAIAEKSLKEVTYHLRWSSEWVLRLGDGTDESHRRLEEALKELWAYTGEYAEPAGFEKEMPIDLDTIRKQWSEKTTQLLKEAGLNIPEKTYMQSGGKEGIHTEHMGYILTELQYLQRTYPGAEW